MSNQNPSEVHGPIGASNHRSHTSRLIVSLSPTQPALWFPSVVYALSFPAAPFPRGTVPTRARCRAERTGRDRTGRDIPQCPGSAPSRSAREATGSRCRLAPRPPRRAERARDAHHTPSRHVFWGSAGALPRLERGPGSTAAAAHLRLHGLHLYPFP